MPRRVPQGAEPGELFEILGVRSLVRETQREAANVGTFSEELVDRGDGVQIQGKRQAMHQRARTAAGARKKKTAWLTRAADTRVQESPIIWVRFYAIALIDGLTVPGSSSHQLDPGSV